MQLLSDFYNAYIAFFNDLFHGLVDWKQVFLLAFTPLFVLAILIEWLVMRRRGLDHSFQLSFLFTNLNLQALYQLAEFVLHAAFIFVAMEWLYAHRLFNVQLSVWNVVPIYLLQEFCYYWFHRSSHRIRWFWSAHQVHHSGEMMNFSTAARQALLYPVVGYWLFFAPLLLIGITPAQTLVLYGVNLGIQFFTHTEAVGKLPAWIEYVFNTPSHHRVHHGRNREYMDKNYGGTIILFDRWFGTYQEEVEQVVYGIEPPIKRNNLFTLNFHEFIAMFRDAARPGPLSQRLKHFWGPPEWKRSERDQTD